MTTHDRDKVIAAAKEARIDFDGINTSLPLYVATAEEMGRFYAIAHEAGRVAEREEFSDAIADSKKQVAMLRDALDQLLDDMGDDGHCVCEAAKYQAREALAATDGLFGLILCEKKPVAYTAADFCDDGIPLYRAWEQKP